MDYFTIFLVIVLSLLLLYELYLRTSPGYRAAKQFPSPSPLPIFGNIFILLSRDPVSTFMLARELAHRFNDSYGLLLGSGLIVNAIKAKESEALLSSTRLIDKNMIYTFLHPFLGVGLLNSTGSKWFHRRKILTAAFHFNILPKFLNTFHEECEKLVQRLNKDVDQGKTTSLQQLAARFTLNTICGIMTGSLKALFGLLISVNL